MGFSIELEAIALVILLVIGLFHYDRDNTHNIKYQWFNLCLIMSACAVISNLITCIMAESIYPIFLQYTANSIYFITIISSMTLVAAYVFFLVFAHMRDCMCYKIIVRLIMFLYVLQMILVLVNLWTGCYFYFEDNKYCRGPLNKLGFVVMTIEVFLFCLCYF